MNQQRIVMTEVLPSPQAEMTRSARILAALQKLFQISDPLAPRTVLTCMGYSRESLNDTVNNDLENVASLSGYKIGLPDYRGHTAVIEIQPPLPSPLDETCALEIAHVFRGLLTNVYERGELLDQRVPQVRRQVVSWNAHGILLPS